MLPALLLVAACASWHGGVTGFYRGEVESVGPKAIDTWIEDSTDGLHGRYVCTNRTATSPGPLSPSVTTVVTLRCSSGPTSTALALLGCVFCQIGIALKEIGAAKCHSANFRGVHVPKDG